LIRVSLITLVVYLVYIYFIRDPSTLPRTIFKLESVTGTDSYNIGIRGSVAPLSWDESIILTKKGNAFSTAITFPDTTTDVEFKFVKELEENEIEWEGIENRFLNYQNSKGKSLSFNWNIDQEIDVSSLPLISSEALLKDYKLIEEMVLNLHPGTYRYNDVNSIKSELETLKSSFSESLSIGDAYLNMSRVTAAIQCDHTKVGFNNQKRNVNAVIHGQADKLPFTFRWHEDEMIVVYDASPDNSLPSGTRILKINQVSIQDIKEQMISFIAADGNTYNNRLAKMEVDGYDFRYNAFDVFFPLLFPVKEAWITVDIILPEGSEAKIIDVPTMTREERSKTLAMRYPSFPESRDNMWKFEIQDDGIGVLTINSFGLMGWKRMTIDYKQFLNEAFTRLKNDNIDKLIIDIRQNTGGSDEIKHELFSYLEWERSILNKPIRNSRSRYKEFPQSMKQFIQTWGDDPWYYNLEPDIEKHGYYIFNESAPLNIIPKKDNSFKGDVVLLTSPLNTSLAYYTAADFKRFKIGTIIGQETGGNQRGINGGQILFLRLPGSGIEIDFPIIGGFTFGDQPDSGEIPDVIVNPTRRDLLLETDLVMEKAKKYLIEI
jgi:hypothetical protein